MLAGCTMNISAKWPKQAFGRIFRRDSSSCCSTHQAATSRYNFLSFDLVTGFHHNSDRDTWQHATFLPGERFSISEFRPEIYNAERLDSQNSWSAICTLRKDQSDDSFSCRDRTNEFHFHRKELRFTAFRYFGYWNGSKDSL